MKQVLVACGAGIATSTVVNNAIEEMAKEHNIKVDLKQIKISEVGAYVDTADLLVTTAMTQKNTISQLSMQETFNWHWC